ncbi:hypothetical protein [Streptosporangium lutulentum]|uniref:AbiTii domain-containing protein n=1 Tax=Streptosporangium lutulentum TaxID=1461250 RepID=A0ABT9QU36_9ACTN|nr:hypothetical protein [Streptosporangium lutulentum]MDP9850267.1 hypothetical protein [Streptosporangium lutulentum]
MAEHTPLPDRDASYLDQIERGALDLNTSIADVLRLCVALGGRAKSQHLRDWALKELNGYELDDELPPYRIVNASLYMDNTNRAGLNRIPQQIAPAMLPKEVRADIGEEMHLRQKIVVLEAEARKAQAQDEHLTYTFSQSAMVANLMTTRGWEKGEIPQRQMVSAIYWRVSPAELLGVVDHVRTVLTQLVAELVATMPTGQEVPSAAQADRAVNIVVNGGDGHQFVL